MCNCHRSELHAALNSFDRSSCLQVVVGGYIGNADCKATANANIRKHFFTTPSTSTSAAVAAAQKAAGAEPQDAASVLGTIVTELGTSTAAINPEAVRGLVSQLLDAERVFVCGMGRSGFAMRGFTMRLAHLGISAHFVGEVTTPPIAAGDLLLLGSGSGRTASLINHAETAAQIGASYLPQKVVFRYFQARAKFGTESCLIDADMWCRWQGCAADNRRRITVGRAGRADGRSSGCTTCADAEA